jgi:hypothetical protein
LGQALAAQVRIVAWRKSCNHCAEPDIATQVAQHGSGMPVIAIGRGRCTALRLLANFRLDESTGFGPLPELPIGSYPKGCH